MVKGNIEEESSSEPAHFHGGAGQIKRNRHSESPIGHYLVPAILIASLVFILRIAATTPIAGEITPIPGEHILQTVVGYAVLANELFAALVIAVASIQGLIQYLRTNFRRKPLPHQISDSESIRLHMGHKLSLALEFAVAADILRVAISPTVSSLVVVFTIILLRVLLNYFLEHDSQTIRECRYIPELEDDNEEDAAEIKA